MKAPFILRHNITALLAARKETATSLARYCGNHKTWASQFLTGKRDELQLEDIDKIADFFGIANYQLFQPGINTLTERRRTLDRRASQERRIGHQGRQLAGLRTELNKLPAIASAHGPQITTRPSASPEPVKRILARAEAEIHAFYAREQTPAARVDRSSLPERRRKSSGSHTPPK